MKDQIWRLRDRGKGTGSSSAGVREQAVDIGRLSFCM